MTQRTKGVAATPPGHSDEPASSLAADAGSVPNAEHPNPVGNLRERMAWQIMTAKVPHSPPVLIGAAMGYRTLGYYLGVGLDHFSHPFSRHDALLFAAVDAILAAQGIEAKGGDAKTGPVRQDESPVRDSECAPTPSHNSEVHHG